MRRKRPLSGSWRSPGGGFAFLTVSVEPMPISCRLSTLPIVQTCCATVDCGCDPKHLGRGDTVDKSCAGRNRVDVVHRSDCPCPSESFPLTLRLLHLAPWNWRTIVFNGPFVSSALRSVQGGYRFLLQSPAPARARPQQQNALSLKPASFHRLRPGFVDAWARGSPGRCSGSHWAIKHDRTSDGL